MDFRELIGEVCLFYGVDNHMFKLDDQVWEAVEDESDGYRSMLGVIKTVQGGIFFREPLAVVEVKEVGNSELDGYVLYDENYHDWLRVGTDNSDDYYPQFIFSYHPIHHSQLKYKPPKSPKINDHEINPFDRLFDPRDI